MYASGWVKITGAKAYNARAPRFASLKPKSGTYLSLGIDLIQYWLVKTTATLGVRTAYDG
jgi:hypothetical protein